MMNSAVTQRVFALAIASTLGLAACHKKEPAEAAPAPQAAAPAAPAAAPASQDASAASEEQEQLEAKKKALAVAMADNELTTDPKGQWAVSATASSAWDDAKDQQGYSAWQATGKPNVERYGDAQEAWAAKTSDGGIEWLKLDYATPVHAAAVRIRQNQKPGVVVKIELIDEAGSAHTIWEGVDDTQYEANTISWLQKKVDPTPYRVKSVKLTLATNMISGDNEIDAVQLVSQ